MELPIDTYILRINHPNYVQLIWYFLMSDCLNFNGVATIALSTALGAGLFGGSVYHAYMYYHRPMRPEPLMYTSTTVSDMSPMEVKDIVSRVDNRVLLSKLGCVAHSGELSEDSYPIEKFACSELVGVPSETRDDDSGGRLSRWTEIPENVFSGYRGITGNRTVRDLVFDRRDKYTKRIYNLTKKVSNDFDYMGNIERNGGYVNFGYDDGSKYDNGNVKLSVGYEGGDWGALRYGTNLAVGNTALKHHNIISNDDINYMSLASYIKLKSKILDISTGLFARNFFDGDNLKRDFRSGSGNYSLGYFVGLHKDVELSRGNHFRVCSTLFDIDTKLNNTCVFGDKLFRDSISYGDLYVESAIELSSKYLAINGIRLIFVPALKYDWYVNNRGRITHVSREGSEYAVRVKNKDKPRVSLQNKVVFPSDYAFIAGADLAEDNNTFYLNLSKSF